jgi:hypothetical protein
MENPDRAEGSKAALWSEVMARTGSDPHKRHNGQMDVVLSVWEAGLLSAQGIVDVSGVHI